jgi:predicted DNA binding CopG/RHH family protein
MPRGKARKAPTRIVIRASEDELDWVKHAASLRQMSLAEYVKRAINTQLRREGVDAVLFRERD